MIPAQRKQISLIRYENPAARCIMLDPYDSRYIGCQPETTADLSEVGWEL
jgi:hypothetical protein